MESEETKKSKYLVPKGTTHLMMWVGGALPTDRIVKYNKECCCGDEKQYRYEDTEKRLEYKIFFCIEAFTAVDYVKTLKGECERMLKKGESCILVYDSKMVNKEGEEELKKIVGKIPNCYLVDYEVFKQQLGHDKNTNTKDGETIKSFIDHIDEIIEYNKEYPSFDWRLDNIYNIGNLVDCMRMLLLLYPGKLKEIANQTNKKTQQLQDKNSSLLYHDFDILQKKEEDLFNKSELTTLLENDKQQCLFFSTPMDGESGIFENGIIFANSPNNQNDGIMNIINCYLPKSKGSKPNTALYNSLVGDSISINNFSEQYKNEAHRSWNKGRNRTESIMIEFDGDYSSIPESKFIAIINWFCENMRGNETAETIDEDVILLGGEQKKITFVDKKRETSQVLLNDFIQNIIKHATAEDSKKMQMIYNGVKDNKQVDNLTGNDKRLERFKIACIMCFGRPIPRSEYIDLFDFSEYKSKCMEEKAKNTEDKNFIYDSHKSRPVNNNIDEDKNLHSGNRCNGGFKKD